MLYLLLFVACIAVELSLCINTENVIKKIGIGFIAVGALIQYGGKHSVFIEWGILIYLIANICSAYCMKRQRRTDDKFPQT